MASSPRLALLLTVWLTAASAAAADWEVRTIAEGKKTACTAVSAKRGISDGYQDVTAWIDEGILVRRGDRYLVADLEALRRYADAAHGSVVYSVSR